MPKIIRGIDWAEVESRFAAVSNISMVAKEFGISPQAIRRHLTNRGVDVTCRRVVKECACGEQFESLMYQKTTLCRKCSKNKYAKDYRQANGEKMREARRKYYRENKDKHQVWCARWRDKNREHLRRYYKETAHRYADTRLRYIQARREKAKAGVV